MQKRSIKVLCLIFAAVICLGVLSACQKKGDPLAKSGFESLTVDAKGKLCATVTLDMRTVQEKKGEKAYFYELLPGETTDTILDHDPLDSTKVGASMEFSCPLTDEDGRSRLYSSFYVIFQDGTLMREDGFYLENPQRLASYTEALLWDGSIKALTNADAFDASMMNVAHVSYEVALSELMNGTETVEFQGNTYTYSSEVLARLDKQIRSASHAGMQVTLTLRLDSVPSVECFAAVAELLAVRYADDEIGRVSAWMLCVNDSSLADRLCRMANLALRSHVANGRVYVVAPEGLSLADTQAFFANLQKSFAESGGLQWGAAVIPQCDAAPWENTEPDALTVDEVAVLSEYLFSASFENRPSWLALYGVAFDAADEDKQAAAYAYTYRVACDANVHLLFYRDHVNEATGLRGEDGTSRRIVSVLSDIDAGLLPADDRLCAEMIGEKWMQAENRVSRTEVSGTSNVGTAGLEENVLFDFTTGECYGFTGVGNATDPESHHSAALNAPVLYTWIAPTYGSAGGVRTLLENGKSLSGATSLSFRLLTQIPDVSATQVTLLLEGLTEDGTRVSYESTVEITNGSWQTVTFGISAFSSELDVAKPCVLTLTTEPAADTDAEYVLWVSGVNVRYPEKSMGWILTVLIIVVCALITALPLLLLYRKSANRTRARRR